MFSISIPILLFVTPIFGFESSLLSSHTTCQSGEIITRIRSNGDEKIEEAYLDGLKNYPDDKCHPKWIQDSLIEFRFNISTFRRCGITRVINKATGAIKFYSDVNVQIAGDKDYKLFAHCQSSRTADSSNDLNSTSLIRRRRQNILPAGFKEEENPVIVEEKIGKAPEPILRMAVRQDGRVVGQELTVIPGTPLTVGVTLDPVSKDIYGILVSKLEVTDTLKQSETLVHNGCSVDPYLFENFLSTDSGDLMAKFKAFKFPESNYVMFVATVNVCLTNCQGLTCSNGQTGFGRRKRDVEPQSNFVIETSTILRVA